MWKYVDETSTKRVCDRTGVQFRLNGCFRDCWLIVPIGLGSVRLAPRFGWNFLL
jgi:hypothetical protein